MKTIIFVCHGNICRSPAAEWIMKNLLIRYHLEDKFFIYSRATSLEEIGNDIYPPMKRALYSENIPFFEHKATQITKQDYEQADYIFYMDNNNLRNLNYLIPDTKQKYINITSYNEAPGIIDDPWYSGAFEDCVEKIKESCDSIIRNLLLKH